MQRFALSSRYDIVQREIFLLLGIAEPANTDVAMKFKRERAHSRKAHYGHNAKQLNDLVNTKDINNKWKIIYRQLFKPFIEKKNDNCIKHVEVLGFY